MPVERKASANLEPLTRAEQEAVQSLVVQIRDAAKFDWRAAAFLIERKHKADWGRPETIDATLTTRRAEGINRRLLEGGELMDYYAQQEKERKG